MLKPPAFLFLVCESPCYDAEMELLLDMTKRWVALAVLGLLLMAGVLGSMVWLYQTAQVYPGLAEHISAIDTHFFLRSTDINTIRRAAKYYGLTVSIPRADTATRYELAILSSQSNQPNWAFLLHMDGQDFITASTGASILESGQLSRALSRSSFFRTHIPKESDNIGWARVSTLALPESPASDIVRTVLSPYSDVSWEWGTGSQIEIDLKSHAHSPLFPSSKKLPTVAEDSPLLSFALRHPAEVFGAFDEELTKKNQQRAEGMRGIAQSLVKDFIGFGDLQSVGTDLLAEPALLTMTRGSGAVLRAAIIGTASDRSSLHALVDAVVAMKAQGITRSLVLNSETTRADVRLGTEDGAVQNEGGWTVSGGEGAAIATKGLTYVLAQTVTEALSLTQSLEHTIDAETAGFVHIPWIVHQGSRIPLSVRRDAEMLLHAIFAEVPDTIGWLAKQEPGSLRLTLDLPSQDQ